jgi:hypothetical protein
VPPFPPPSGALLSPVGIPRVTEAGRDRVEVPGPEIRHKRARFAAQTDRSDSELRALTERPGTASTKAVTTTATPALPQ